jgi:hypothetical protein
VRFIDPTCFDLIVSELDRTDSPGAVRLAQALNSLRAVAWFTYGNNLEAAFGFTERHGAALTELDCSFWPHQHDAADRALSCCARLESLSHARHYNAKIWLGLTHLHTLRGVDLGAVPVQSIAAALPRLNTLAAFINATNVPPVTHKAVAGFFEDLAPRLRVFHFHGPWPVEGDQAPAAVVPQPLPLLQELIFSCDSNSSVARGFIGAQPAMLQMPHAAVADLLRTMAAGGEATHQPLARVRDLCFAPGAIGGGSGDPRSSDVARLLREAPQLRKFNTGSLKGGLDWVDNPAFTGLVHPWLRSVRVVVETMHADLPDGCGVQLRRLHFPRLQQLIVNTTQQLVHEEQ